MGLPAPGVDLKLVPNGGKLEARVRGPNITPGYWRQPELTAKAFDEEGFYQLGDALKFEDPDDPAKGLLFDGRIAEDFKLATGTWVSVGPLRARLLGAFRAVHARRGHRRRRPRHVAVLIFPNIDACRRLAPDLPADAAASAVVADRARGERVSLPAQFIRADRDRQFEPDLPRHPRGRTALARRRRDDRQGVDQPAGGVVAQEKSRAAIFTPTRRRRRY